MTETKPKLQAKHLIPYLGTGLEVEIMTQSMRDHGASPVPAILTGYTPAKRPWMCGTHNEGQFYELSEITPIMRPFEDLTREIEHQGERFVPVERIKEMLLYNQVEINTDLSAGNKVEMMVITFTNKESRTPVITIGEEKEGGWWVHGGHWVTDQLREWHFPIGLPPGSYKETE